jgi:hypothetical protein
MGKKQDKNHDKNHEVDPTLVGGSGSSLIDLAKRRPKVAVAEDRSADDGDGKQVRFALAKPHPEEFFWVHDGDDWRVEMRILEDRTRTSNPVFVLHPDYEPPEEIQRWVKGVTIVACITRQNTVYLWPAKHSTESAADVICEGIENPPVRPIWVPADKEYKLKLVPEELHKYKPAWPPLSFAQMFDKATEGRIIASDNHPLIRRLMGK